VGRQSELKEDRNDLKADRQLAGEEYLLKKLILTNPTIFPAYQDNKEKGITDKIIRKNQVYSFKSCPFKKSQSNLF
jgi:hypothetical protein